MKEYQHTLLAVAHTDLGSVPFGHNHGRTLRLVVPANTAGHALHVDFSNICGARPVAVGAASVALCDESGALVPDTLAPLTVDGRLYFNLYPGEDVSSDVLPFAFEAGDYLALNLYYPDDTPVTSGNWLGNTAYRSRPGNFSADTDISGTPHLMSRFTRTVVGADMAVQLTTVSRIVAHSANPALTLACFGDSITQQCTWTVPLTKRLYRVYPGAISLCNLGITGNRLLRDGPASLRGLYGKAGVARFAHDILALPGLTHCILALGANDVGQPGTHGLPLDEVVDPEVYAETLAGMAGALRERGVKVFAPTITPRRWDAPYDAARDEIRQEMNRWIRTTPCFDAVLDFDAVLQREDGAPGMKDRYAQPDGLHPTPLAGLWLAKSIPLSLFAPGGGTDG